MAEHVGTDSIRQGDSVSWIDKRTQRRTFGTVAGMGRDYTTRVFHNGKIVTVPDRELTKEVG